MGQCEGLPVGVTGLEGMYLAAGLHILQFIPIHQLFGTCCPVFTVDSTVMKYTAAALYCSIYKTLEKERGQCENLAMRGEVPTPVNTLTH
jgi:hypothetical protein